MIFKASNRWQNISRYLQEVSHLEQRLGLISYSQRAVMDRSLLTPARDKGGRIECEANATIGVADVEGR